MYRRLMQLSPHGLPLLQTLQHLDETRRQAERVERCLELLGTDRSSLKDIGGMQLFQTESSDRPVAARR